MDYGSAFVGNVGNGEVKDFTAIGDVIITGARLQASATDGEIVVSRRVVGITREQLPGAEPRLLELKGKAEPEQAYVVTKSWQGSGGRQSASQ